MALSMEVTSASTGLGQLVYLHRCMKVDARNTDELHLKLQPHALAGIYDHLGEHSMHRQEI
eukprot:5336174-Prorocentrum_lima.AAC.1